MGQITIYLENEIEKKMRAFIEASHLSKSKWIAKLIEEKLKDEWPETVTHLAGAWKDIPTAEEIRENQGTDIVREAF